MSNFVISSGGDATNGWAVNALCGPDVNGQAPVIKFSLTGHGVAFQKFIFGVDADTYHGATMVRGDVETLPSGTGIYVDVSHNADGSPSDNYGSLVGCSWHTDAVPLI